jgi:radical SAM superfamily enzyme YgiQ (UPF0313 family)
MMEQKKLGILINPPIYDTQYWARWSMPHGLLKIGSWLRNNGYSLQLFDCLNPYSEDSGVLTRDADFESYDAVRRQKKSVVVMASTEERHVVGYENGEIPLSYRLQDNEKWKYVFGMPINILEQRLFELKESITYKEYDTIEVWVTSIMTYWWESTRDVIAAALRVFPEAKIRVGGIYPTLAPWHATKKLVEGAVSIKGSELRLGNEHQMQEHLIVEGEIPDASDLDLATDLYKDNEIPPYTILTSSRGCPHICSYCASNVLNGGTKVKNRGFNEVMKEIKDKFRSGTKVFCFYEDNLLMNMNEFKRILKAVMEDKTLHGIRIYAPEGIEIGVAMSDRKTFLLKTKSDKNILATLSINSLPNGETRIVFDEDLTQGAVQVIENNNEQIVLMVGYVDTVILQKQLRDHGRHDLIYVNEEESSNGLYLTAVPEIVYLMKLAGFEKIYLPLETIKKETNARWNRAWNSNLSRFESLLNALEEVGFDTRKQSINAFVMFGLPGEDIEEVYDTALYASQRVGSVIPMLFTPVPSTEVYEMYRDYIEEHGFDLQHLNGKLFPFLHMLKEQHERKYPDNSLEVTDYLRLETFMQRLNSKVKGESVNIYGESKVATLFRKSYSEYESVLKQFD